MKTTSRKFTFSLSSLTQFNQAKRFSLIMTLQWILFILVNLLLHKSLGHESTYIEEADLYGHQKSAKQEVNQFDALYQMAGGGNPTRTPDGDIIIEGDIAVPQPDLENEIFGRKAVPSSYLYWPNGTIPYLFHSSITSEEAKVIKLAMDHWENTTCINFKQAKSTDPYKIRFRSDREGCWSLVGRQVSYYNKFQDVSIGKGCAQWPTVAHEIGHVVGFYHEQSRNDRDQAIHINWENVLNGFEVQFRKESDRNFGVPYDYMSVMQYPSWAFSKDILSKNTIVTREPKYQRLLGMNRGLTFRDKKIVSYLYSCNRNCPKLLETKCLNGGFLQAYSKDTRVCKCECPPNTAGEFCENLLNNDYYEAIDPMPCGGNVTLPSVIETPKLDSKSINKRSCTWDIKAPQGMNVQLEILEFKFTPRFKTLSRRLYGKCLNESVEIRLNDEYHGDIYCGDDLKPGTKLISKASRMLVLVFSEKDGHETGLKANVNFIINKTVTTQAPKQSTVKPSTPTSVPSRLRRLTTVRPKTIITSTSPKTSVDLDNNIWDRIKGIQQGKVVKKIPPEHDFKR